MIVKRKVGRPAGSWKYGMSIHDFNKLRKRLGSIELLKLKLKILESNPQQFKTPKILKKINIHLETYEKLDYLKQGEESFNAVIERLISFFQDHNGRLS